MAKSLISLDIIAAGLCDDIGDSVGKQKFKFTRYLLDGYSKLHNFIGQSYSIKTEVFKSSNSIVMPCDFIRETKVGVKHNGRIAVLTISNDTHRHELKDSEAEKYTWDIWNGVEGLGYGGFYFYNAYSGGQFLGELYGTGRTVLNSGFYSIDRGEGVIHIGSFIPNGAEIIVEYKSDGISKGLELVPMEMKTTLEFYAKFKYYADKNPNMSIMNLDLYKKEYNQLQRMYNWEDALYATGKINELYSPSNF